MIIQSRRFGDFEVDERRVIHLKEGLLGFPKSRRFIVVDHPTADADLPFKLLLSIDEPDLCFLVTDPGVFFKDYVFELSPDQAEQLQIKNQEEVSVIVILTVPENPRHITANLRGPVVVNISTMVGMQVVLEDPRLSTRHYIFVQSQEGTKGSSEDRVERDPKGVQGEMEFRNVELG